jgi:integrase
VGGSLQRPPASGPVKDLQTKAEAQAFAEAVETDIDRGTYLDPRLGKKTFRDGSEEWLRARKSGIKPTTFMSYRNPLDVHLLPEFGQTAMSRIRPLDVQRVLARMAEAGLSQSRLRQARQVLSMILNAAVDNGYIGRNPVPRERVKGREPHRAQHPLTFQQVHEVANAVPDRYKALIYVLAYGGLRWGEAAA